MLYTTRTAVIEGYHDALSSSAMHEAIQKKVVPLNRDAWSRLSQSRMSVAQCRRADLPHGLGHIGRITQELTTFAKLLETGKELSKALNAEGKFNVY